MPLDEQDFLKFKSGLASAMRRRRWHALLNKTLRAAWSLTSVAAAARAQGSQFGGRGSQIRRLRHESQIGQQCLGAAEQNIKWVAVGLEDQRFGPKCLCSDVLEHVTVDQVVSEDGELAIFLPGGIDVTRGRRSNPGRGTRLLGCIREPDQGNNDR